MRLSIILIFILNAFNLLSQNVVEVTYSKESSIKSDLYKNIQERNPENEFGDIIKSTNNKSDVHLIIDKDESYFEPKEKEADLSSDDVQIVIVSPNYSEEYYSVYRNHKQKNQVVTKEFLTRNFLIETPIDLPSWQLTSEKKDILGYTCTKATLKQNNKNVTAWFTPDIPISEGPDIYWGLPGLILELGDSNNSYRCDEINLKSDKYIPMLKPGRKVTEKEFDDIKRKKIEDMKNRK